MDEKVAVSINPSADYSSRRPAKIDVGIFFDIEAGTWKRYDPFLDEMLKMSLKDVLEFYRKIDINCQNYHKEFVESGEHVDLAKRGAEQRQAWLKSLQSSASI
jgi:hypothetical protein